MCMVYVYTSYTHKIMGNMIRPNTTELRPTDKQTVGYLSVDQYYIYIQHNPNIHIHIH